MVSVVSSFVLGKAKDVLIGIAEDWVKDKVKDKVGYLLDSKGKIEELKVVREEIQKAVKEAEKKGEDVKDEVQNLLIDMEGIMENWNKLRTESNYEPSSLHSIYTLSKEAVEKMKSIDELLPKKLYSVSNPAPLPTMESIYKGDFKVFESTKLTMDKVMEALKDENIHVIGVYGMGGVGKTSLAKEVGKQVEKEKLFDKVVMAVVSQEPNHKEMQGQIADMLGLKFEEESVMGRALKLSRRLEKVGSILVILDDIWAKLELKELGIPFDGNNMGCKILFTTRRQDVCHAMKTQADIPLSILSEDDAWDLFRRNAGDVVENDALIRDVAKDVAKECGGLPIAIVTVAGALRDKRDRQEWDYARRELRLSEFQNIEDLDLKVRSCLKWSYDYLRDLEAQRLFLHCCLFPEDYAIYIEDLILYSFGVGLLKNAETIEDARCRTRRIVKKLKASSLLLQGWDEESIKMHDVVRDVAIHIASNKGEHDELFLVRGGNLEEWPTMESTADYTAISLIYHRIRKLPNSLEFSKLRTLVLRRAYVQMEIPDTFFQGMMALRSLDMSFNYGLHILPSSIQWLTNLRTLNLQECIILEDISMLGNLKGLVILNLSGCEYIEGLPENMAQLTNLRSLNLTGASGIKIIPPNVISCWSQLEELLMDSSFKDWEIEGISGGGGHGCKARLAELNALRRLTSLQVEIKDPRSLPDDFVFQDLGVFHIDINFRDSYDYRIEKVLRIKGLRTQEKELCIKGIRTQKIKTVFSNQLKKTKVLRLQDCEGLNLCGCSDIEDFPSRALFSNLNILDLKECKSLRSIFSPINTRNLQQLEDLRVEGCDSLEEIFVEEEGGDKIVLPKLKTLFLSKLPSLTSICGNRNPSDWPSLEQVDIHDCRNLRGIFSRATTQSLLQLKKLEVHNCDSLEEIFVKEGEGEAVVDKIALPQLRTLHLKHLPSLTSIYGNKNPSDWPSLELVDIYCCPKLRGIFSCATTQSLLHLEVLQIHRCDSLEEIFVKEGEGEAVVDKIALPQLRTLHLKHLPSLTSIYGNKNPSDCPSLELVDIYCCPKLRGIFSRATTQSLLQLKKLEVERCHSLEEIFVKEGEGEAVVDKIALPQLRTLHLRYLPSLTSIYGNRNPSDWPSLELVHIYKCDNLRGIFSRATTQSLLQLKKLEVHNCDSLEEIFVKEGEGEAVVDKIALPQLRALYLEHLPSLRSIYANKNPSDWPSLELVHIYKCDNLRGIFSRATTQSLLQLKVLQIHRCDSLEEIFVKEGEGEAVVDKIALPQLRTLHLKHLPSLRSIYANKNPSDWPSLELVDIYCCPNLRGIFSRATTQSLLQLKVLQVHNCDSLEEIFVKEGEGEAVVDKIALPQLRTLYLEHLPSLRSIYANKNPSDWPSLELVDIYCCPNLRGIFSRATTQSLLQLKVLQIHRCDSLEEIFVKEGEGEAVVDKIALPQLRTLHLKHLPSLTSIYGNKNPSDWPSLELVDIYCCPNLRGIFSRATTQSLLQLKKLEVHNCDSLEEIFVKEGEGEAVVDKIALPQLRTLYLEHLPSLRSIYANKNPSDWPSLELVDIYCCPNLRGIFSRATTQSLLQLKVLQIHRCDSLEEIFVKEGEGEAVVDKIALPQLRTLHLKHLPSLTSIYGNKNPSDWPSLELVYIHECPSLLHFPFQRQRNAPNLKTITISSVELSRKKLRQKYQELEAEFGELLRLVSEEEEEEEEEDVRSNYNDVNDVRQNNEVEIDLNSIDFFAMSSMESLQQLDELRQSDEPLLELKLFEPPSKKQKLHPSSSTASTSNSHRN